jgi:hypothetical protein
VARRAARACVLRWDGRWAADAEEEAARAGRLVEWLGRRRVEFRAVPAADEAALQARVRGACTLQ